MSKVEYGSITIPSTGNKTLILADSTLNVEKVVLFIADSSSAVSAGFSDATTNFTGSSPYSDENSTYSITHYRNVSGVKTKIFEATVPSNGFSVAGEFKLNVTTLAASITLRMVVFGS